MPSADDFQIVIDHYHERLRQTPGDAELITNLAWSYERIGQYHEAIQEFHRALDINPDDFNAHYGLGLALLGDGQQQAALDQFVLARDLVASKSTDRSEVAMFSQQVEILIRRLS